MQNRKSIITFLIGLLLFQSFGPTSLIQSANASPEINLNSAGNYHVLSGTAVTVSASVTGLNLAEAVVSTTGVADLLGAMATLNGLPSVGVTADLGGKTFLKGTYFSAAALAMTSNVILDAQGDPESTFIFLTPAAMNTTAGVSITLVNGANPCNVYWVSGAAFTFGASSKLSGNFLSAAAVTVGASSEISGRLLAAAAVTVAASVIFKDFSVSKCNGPVGGLAITVPSSVDLGAVEAGGLLSAQMGTIHVADTRSGSGLMWNVSIDASPMKDSANNVLPFEKMGYELQSLSGTAGLHLVKHDFESLLDIGTSPLTILSADQGNSSNEASWIPLIKIHVPYQQAAGRYSGAIVHSVY